jgi:hypothetical protein
MKRELEEIWKEEVVACSRYHHVFAGGKRKVVPLSN